MMVYKTAAASLVLLAVLITGGCTYKDKKILDDLALGMTIGYDKLGNNRVMITKAFPQTAEEAKEPNETIQVIARSEKDAREEMRPLAGKTVVAGQAKTILFGEKTARQGILEYAESLQRDPSVSSMVFMGVVKGKAGEVVKKKFSDKERTGMYLYSILRQEERTGGIGPFRLSTFLRDQYAEGRDEVLPYLATEKQGVKIQGMAVLRQGKMVTQISEKEVPIYYLMNGNDYPDHITMLVPLDTGKRKPVTVSFLKNKRTLSCGYMGKPSVHLRLNLRAVLTEYPPEYEMKTRENVQMFERKIEKVLERKSSLIIERLQKANVDPLGLGRYYKAWNLTPKWTEAWWRQQYPDMKISAEIHVTITRIGLVR